MDLYLYEFEANTPIPEATPDPSLAFSPTLEVKTCQRTFLLSLTPRSLPTARRAFEGAEAYAFLLRFASGLESEIKGETDVFGQLKNAIRDFSLKNTSSDFEALFLKLFEDTKEIRSNYLQGIGGNTYGALARRILAPGQETRCLLIGAGQISKSVAPYFADSELMIYNRSAERLLELKENLEKKGYRSIETTSDEAELSMALLSSDQILIATPVGSEVDSLVIQALSLWPPHRRPTILHLGAQTRELRAFTDAGLKVLSLTDLFNLEKEQNSFREKQIEQAMDACRKRALLRSLARSIHIPHGWEDLALFS